MFNCPGLVHPPLDQLCSIHPACAARWVGITPLGCFCLSCLFHPSLPFPLYLYLLLSLLSPCPIPLFLLPSPKSCTSMLPYTSICLLLLHSLCSSKQINPSTIPLLLSLLPVHSFLASFSPSGSHHSLCPPYSHFSPCLAGDFIMKSTKQSSESMRKTLSLSLTVGKSSCRRNLSQSCRFRWNVLVFSKNLEKLELP